MRANDTWSPCTQVIRILAILFHLTPSLPLPKLLVDSRHTMWSVNISVCIYNSLMSSNIQSVLKFSWLPHNSILELLVSSRSQVCVLYLPDKYLKVNFTLKYPTPHILFVLCHLCETTWFLHLTEFTTFCILLIIFLLFLIIWKGLWGHDQN